MSENDNNFHIKEIEIKQGSSIIVNGVTLSTDVLAELNFIQDLDDPIGLLSAVGLTMSELQSNDDIIKGLTIDPGFFKCQGYIIAVIASLHKAKKGGKA